MVAIKHIFGPSSFPALTAAPAIDRPQPSDLEQHLINPAEETLSILSYNVLLPNSVDGWWTYKMYAPPLPVDQKYVASWEYRKKLLSDRIQAVDADVVCLQEVSPASFEEDFAFMKELGYDGHELFKKGRFRPATFWKTSRHVLASAPVHKDRTLLTALVPTKIEPGNVDNRGKANDKKKTKRQPTWYVLNCHLQAGKEGKRRVRQIHEGVKAVLTLARKLKEPQPESKVPLVVCGDFNGGPECGAIRFLEDGKVDDTFLEDGEPVVKGGSKDLPLDKPMTDVASTVTRENDASPPATMVVAELITNLVHGAGADAASTAYENPRLSDSMVDRLKRIHERFATQVNAQGEPVMNIDGVSKWLIEINRQVGRGDEFREAARQMGWKDEAEDGDQEEECLDGKARISLPPEGTLSFDGFRSVYEAELRGGKFWGIAHDMAVLGEPLDDAGIFEARFDRIYCSAALQPRVVMDFVSNKPCPNELEASDHLPVAAAFTLRAEGA